MSLYLNKILLISVLLILHSGIITAYVYVYEVITDGRRFNTISKLSPDSYVMNNGGKDLIKQLKIVKIYKNNDFKKALEDFNLGQSNSKALPYKYPDDNRTRFSPFIWWR